MAEIIDQLPTREQSRSKTYPRRFIVKTALAAGTAVFIGPALQLVNRFTGSVDQKVAVPPSEVESIGNNLVTDPFIEEFSIHKLPDGQEVRFASKWTPIVDKPVNIIRTTSDHGEYADSFEHTAVSFGKAGQGKNALTLEIYTQKTEDGRIIKYPSWRSDPIQAKSGIIADKEYQFKFSYEVAGNDLASLYKTKPAVKIVPIKSVGGHLNRFGDEINYEKFPIDPLKWHHDQGFRFKLPSGSTHFLVELSIRDYSENTDYDTQKRIIHFAHPFVGEVIKGERPQAVTQPPQS